METEINAGRVAMVPKGEWSASTAYVRLDVVYYNGSSYVASQDSTGQNPSTATNYWQLLARGVDPSNYYTKTETNTKLGSKQDALVSGQNIKSINGQSVLGAGNLELGELFVVTMTQHNSVYTADKSVSEIYTASYTNGKPVIAIMRDISNPVFILTDCNPDGDSYVFSAIESNTVTTLRWKRTDDYTYELETIVLQPHLVSGTNIKTVNSTSLLGSGDIVIPKGDKGDKGDQGNSGYTGAAGELEVVNNLTQGGATAAFSSEMGKELGENVGIICSQGKDDNIGIYRTVGTVPDPPVDNPSGTRLRIIFAVSKGSRVQVESTWTTGFFAGVWPTLQLAAGSLNAYALQQMKSTYNNDTLDTVATVDGYFCVSLKPSSEIAITDAIKAEMLAATSISITDEIVETVNIIDKIGYPLQPFWEVQHSSGTISTSGTRFSLLFHVAAGYTVRFQSSWQAGVYGAIYANEPIALGGASTNVLQRILDVDGGTSFSTKEHKDVTNVSGVLRIGTAKTDNSAFTQQDIADFLASLTYEIIDNNSLQGKINALSDAVDKKREDALLTFPLPPFVKGSASLSGNAKVDASTYSTYPRMVIHDCVALPYAGCRLRVKVPNDFLMGFRFYNGYNNGDAAYPGAWFKSGEHYTPDLKYSHFMCYLAHTLDGSAADNSYVFDVDAINDLLATGEIAVQYEDCGDVSKRLVASGQQVKSTMLHYTSNKAYNQQGEMPTFVHCSDVHGDTTRWRNAVQLAALIKADAVINTGDSVAYHVENGETFLPTVVSDLMEQMPIISAVGNHDTNGDSTYRSSLNTNLYNNVIKPFEESAGYIMPSSSEYEDAPTYYYRDFATQKIRVITLNLYDKGQPDWNSNAISQKQINWLISTLASTPANYGVLIAYHRSCGGVVKDDNYSKFWQVSSTSGYSPNTWALTGITGNPILDIIDAFIAKSTLTSSFTQSITSNTTQTITISADFTSLNSGVEFIAHVFGHHHRDTIGYYNSTQKQLVLCVCQTTAAYSSVYTSWANPSDLPRFGGGKEQDAVNVYTIDRNAKSVRVAKFGSTLSSETLEQRDCMVIPYAD